MVKLEFSEYDTRLYIKIENNSDSNVSLYSFDITMVIDGKNYIEEYSYYGDYPEIDSELTPNTHTEGIIAFKPLNFNDISKIRIIIDSPYSDNWDIEFQNYVFDFEI